LQLNTLGDAESRDAWRAALVAHFNDSARDLSAESQARLATNPMRILDSKEAQDRPIADSAPDIDAYLTQQAQDFFAAVTSGLGAAGVAWQRNARLVRGLDYYRHTAFEFVTDRLGAQGTVLGGGRYDGLVEALGGPHTPAVGWAAGIERLAMLLGEVAVERPEVLVFANSEDVERIAFQVCQRLRKSQSEPVRADLVSGSYKKRYDKAKASGAIRGLSVERFDGALAVMRLRDFDVADALPVRARIEEALSSKFVFETTEIQNAHSWILRTEK
jgi:histidyl-tRNA synthetase